MAKKTANKKTTKQTVRDKIRAFIIELTKCLLEREKAIMLALVALLSREHLLLLGPPGVAKSLLVREITKRIVDASYYERLMSQTTEPNEVFGPVDLAALSDRGEYRRVSKGALQEAHIGFLDEIFKANSTILNCLLTLTNERLYHEVGYEPQKAPLLSIFGASNETPQEKELGALYDRFPLKMVVTDTVEETSFEALVLGNFGSTVKATLTVDDILEAQTLVEAVVIPQDVVEGLKTICRVEAPAEGIRVSDRTIVKAARVLKAAAWLRGRNEVIVEDLSILADMLWSEPSQTKAVERLVYRVSNPLHLRAIEIEDDAIEAFSAMPPMADWDTNYRHCKAIADNIVTQLRDMDVKLEQEILSSKATNKSRAAQALSKVRELKQAASNTLFRKSGKQSTRLATRG